MVEVQSHGFSFEKWARDTIFDGYTGNYMQKWDIPPEYNQHESLPIDYQNIPVSVKTAKFGSPIGLGDILRQRNINEPFLMIVGFWRQRTSSEKWFEDIGCIKFTPSVWDSLWGNLSLQKLSDLDKIVKDLDSHYSVIRKKAQEMKAMISADSGSQITINPKIDSKKQRRVQCSLPFHVFWKCVGREPHIHQAPELFGFPFDNPILSSARTFNQE